MTKRVYATLELDDLSATLSATPTLDSYGVPGSPDWVVFEDMRVESVEILGQEVKPSALPRELLTEICEQADDWLEYSAWEALE